jgi:hypothetical protein
VIEKQSGMATKQMSPKSHGSAGKLAAVDIHDMHKQVEVSFNSQLQNDAIYHDTCK